MSAEDGKVERSCRPCELNGEKNLNSMQGASRDPASTSRTPDEEPEAAGQMQLRFSCLLLLGGGRCEQGPGLAAGSGTAPPSSSDPLRESSRAGGCLQEVRGAHSGQEMLCLSKCSVF